VPTEFSDSFYALCRVAVERLSLGIERENNLKNISAIIAQFNGDSVVSASHAAEALSFSHTANLKEGESNSYVEAESCILHVGKGITINPLQTKDSDVDKAIAVLTEMKQKAPIY